MGKIKTVWKGMGRNAMKLKDEIADRVGLRRRALVLFAVGCLETFVPSGAHAVENSEAALAPASSSGPVSGPSTNPSARSSRSFLVRLPMLPNRNVESFFAPPVPRAGPKAEPPSAKAPEARPEAKQKKPDAEAMAAFAAYKKKQLEAIESDRQTLMALQAAIQDLGLTKKLDFSGNVMKPNESSTAHAKDPMK